MEVDLLCILNSAGTTYIVGEGWRGVSQRIRETEVSSIIILDQTSLAFINDFFSLIFSDIVFTPLVLTAWCGS